MRIARIEVAIGAAVLMIVLGRFNSYWGLSARLSKEEAALRMAGENATVRSLLGQPLKISKTFARSKDVEGQTDLSIMGPQGRGSLSFIADKTPTRWIFTRLHFADNQHSVDLLDDRLPYLALKDLFTTILPLKHSHDDVTSISLTAPIDDGSRMSVAVELDLDNHRESFRIHTEQSHPTLFPDLPVNKSLVDLKTGRFNLQQTDLFIADTLPVNFVRSYSADDRWDNAFGSGTKNSYDILPTGSRFPYTRINLNLIDGKVIYLPRISGGTSFADAVYLHQQTASEFYRALYFWNGNGWTLRLRDGRKVTFPEAYGARRPAQGAPTAIDDGVGRRIRLERDGERNLTTVASSSGRSFRLYYDRDRHIANIRDDAGHERSYTYDSTGHLSEVRQGGQPLFQFSYQKLISTRNEELFLMKSVCGPGGLPLLRLAYDRDGRVTSEALGDGRMIRFEYSSITQEGKSKQLITVSQSNGHRHSCLY